jgi:hypothetical protein
MKFFAGLLAAVTSGLWAVAVAQVTVFPAQPTHMDTVRVQLPESAIMRGYAPSLTQVSMVGNAITVMLGETDFLPLPGFSLDWPLGQLPAGSYQVEVRLPDRSLGSTSFTVTGRPAGGSRPLWNYTDIWWNPSESGWGLNLVHHASGIIFATWFVYGADGRATWYVVPDGLWESAVEYRGAVYRTTGPTVGETFNPSNVTRAAVGTATFRFSVTDFDAMTLTMSVEGRTVTRNLRRQSF